jgi:hypothetical protein
MIRRMAILTPHVIRKIAVEAVRDPKSVRRVIAGQPCRATVEQAIREAATRLGIALPPPASSPAERERDEHAMNVGALLRARAAARAEVRASRR